MLKQISGRPSTLVATVDCLDDAVTGNEDNLVLYGFLLSTVLAVGFDDHTCLASSRAWVSSFHRMVFHTSQERRQ